MVVPYSYQAKRLINVVCHCLPLCSSLALPSKYYPERKINAEWQRKPNGHAQWKQGKTHVHNRLLKYSQKHKVFPPLSYLMQLCFRPSKVAVTKFTRITFTHSSLLSLSRNWRLLASNTPTGAQAYTSEREKKFRFLANSKNLVPPPNTLHLNSLLSSFQMLINLLYLHR